jgi:DNA-directed RNA polymerase specialized sigma24 family protein
VEDQLMISLVKEVAQQKLPRHERQIVVLRILEGMDVTATARLLGISPRGVINARSRAVSKLRDQEELR